MRAKYIGDGEFLLGIPARDLRGDEFDNLTDAQQQRVMESGLYKMLPDKPVKKKNGKQAGGE